MNQNQNPRIETNDLTFCPSFNCYSSNTTSAAALKISSSLPNQDDLYHDNEFNFVIEDNKISPTTTTYPLFNQKENVCDTLQNLFITEREDDTSSSSEEEGNENENENEPVFCVWRGSTKSDPSSSSSVALTKCKKSSSTGSGSGSGSGSKRWRIRDLLLRRSNSEGKDQQPISNMLLSQHSNNKKVVEAVTKQKRNSVECSVNNGRIKPSSPSVHEIFYVQNRAKTEDGKRRSYLPYRQGLVGFFSNGNGKGKSFPF